MSIFDFVAARPGARWLHREELRHGSLHLVVEIHLADGRYRAGVCRIDGERVNGLPDRHHWRIAGEAAMEAIRELEGTGEG